jgi:ubiquinone/menaquinone biosynthesis C-methylase UbiE
MGAIVTALTAEQGAQDDPEFAAAIDDLPLWSAPFGLRLLEAVPLDPEATVLDVGCGTGFPLLELAHRLGPRARLFGLDPWAAALARARAKCRAQALANVLLVRGVAERLPLRDGVVDLVVSNNGLNNVQDLGKALHECARVTRPGGRLAFTMNLPETMQAFYDALEETLTSRGLDAVRPAVTAHIRAKRPPVEDAEREAVLAEVARRLDAAIRPGEGLRLDVPFACWTAARRARRPS